MEDMARLEGVLSENVYFVNEAMLHIKFTVIIICLLLFCLFDYLTCEYGSAVCCYINIKVKIILLPVYSTLKSAKFLKIHLEMVWVDL